jgi:hypothetical protein
MAVVINELEMSPAAAPTAERGGDSSTRHEGPPTLAPDVLRQIEKALKAKQERNHRLTAY